MNQPNIQFRTATPADQIAVKRVLEVFGPHHSAALAATAETHPEQWRLGLIDGEVISTVRACPTKVWVGQSQLRWVDVGEVGVASHLQGQGIGSQAMADVQNWLAQSEHSVARLGGLTRFYSRFGYEAFPRCTVEFPISPVIRAGTAEISFEELLKPQRVDAGAIRPYDPGDFEGICSLLHSFTRHQTGSRVCDPAYLAPETFTSWLVYAKGEQVLGAMHIAEYPPDATSPEYRVSISEMAYQVGQPVALEALLKHALSLAWLRQASRLTAALPQRAEITRDLQALNLGYTFTAHWGGVASNMASILSLSRLLTDILPTLASRVKDASEPPRFLFDIGDQKAAVSFCEGGARVEEAASDGITLRFTTAQFLAVLLGITPHECPGLTPTERAWADRLLPASRGSYLT